MSAVAEIKKILRADLIEMVDRSWKPKNPTWPMVKHVDYGGVRRRAGHPDVPSSAAQTILHEQYGLPIAF